MTKQGKIFYCADIGLGALALRNAKRVLARTALDEGVKFGRITRDRVEEEALAARYQCPLSQVRVYRATVL